MAMLAELVDGVIGVDTHRDTLTAAAVSHLGGVLAHATTSADAAGNQRLLGFADRHLPGRRCWAVEGRAASALALPGSCSSMANASWRSAGPSGRRTAAAPRVTRWTRSGPLARRSARIGQRRRDVGGSGRRCGCC
jgi:hypothetical protein